MKTLQRFIVFSAILGSAGLARSADTITVKGSDTMVILGQRWAEAYMSTHPGAIVQVTGGGSGTGIAALINGATNIAQASRPMKSEEKAAVQTRQGKQVIEIPVALDGVSVYVDGKNP
ncbi:MAG: substrate-binding domain-containing protein, partial [Elusimicrobiota bacterium]